MKDPATRINRIQNIQSVAIAVIAAGLLALGGYTLNMAANNTDALCAIRATEETRVVQSEKFLAEHPEGGFGYTAAEILQGVEEQQQTVEDLGVLNCPPAPPPEAVPAP